METTKKNQPKEFLKYSRDQNQNQESKIQDSKKINTIRTEENKSKIWRTQKKNEEQTHANVSRYIASLATAYFGAFSLIDFSKGKYLDSLVDAIGALVGLVFLLSKQKSENLKNSTSE